MFRRITAAAVAVLAITAAAAAVTSQRPGELAPTHGRYAPKIDPANFVRVIDNQYLPYKVGVRIHFAGVKDGTRQADDQVVLARTKRILGVKCTTVRDTVAEHGKDVERTDDYYAQDEQGNVWYMGEDAFELQH